jgi:hypothetical protein
VKRERDGVKEPKVAFENRLWRDYIIKRSIYVYSLAILDKIFKKRSTLVK